MCRGYGKSPLIFLLWELGPLGVLEVGVMCYKSGPRGDKICLNSLGGFLTYGIAVEMVGFVRCDRWEWRGMNLDE